MKRKQIAVALASLLSLPAAYVGVLLTRDYISRLHAPTLCLDLPGDLEAANRDFDRRVKLRYLLPERSSVLTTKVQEDGFKLEQGNQAFAQFQSIPNTYIFRIDWGEDAAGNVTGVTGSVAFH